MLGCYLSPHACIVGVLKEFLKKLFSAIIGYIKNFWRFLNGFEVYY